METISAFYPTILIFFAAALFIFNSLRLFRRRNYPPGGPLALPLLGHLYLLKQPIHRTLAALAARHGPVLLLRFGARRVLLVTSPAAAEDCFTGANDIAFANRPALLALTHFTYGGRTLGAAPYGPHWRNLRRLATLHLFSPARIDSFSTARSDEVRYLLRDLFKISTGARGFQLAEMQSKFSELTFNISTVMIAGRRYYGAEATEKAGEGQRLRRIIKESFELSAAASLEDFVPAVRWVSRLIMRNGWESRILRIARESDQFCREMVEERRRKRAEGGEGKTETLVDVMLDMQEADPGYYTDEIVKGMIMNLIVGGTDTSAATMEWALALLLNHPEALEKAKSEIEMHVGYRRLVNDSDLPNLRYLHDVIRETLRLYPAGPLLVLHESSEECVVQGYNIPRGTMLLVNAYAIHRDPAFWTNPLKFRPERFGGGEGEGFVNIPFGYGRRRCPGELLAMRIMGLTLGCLVQCFEWRRVGEEEVDMSEGLGLSMHKAKPLEALYKPNDDMVDVLSHL